MNVHLNQSRVEHQSTKQTYKLTVKQGDRQFSFKAVKINRWLDTSPNHKKNKQKNKQTENTERPFN